MDFKQFKGFDLIMGGFPCQDLSIGNVKRKGLSGERSGLFYELVRAIEEANPTHFLVENNFSMPNEAKEEITRVLGVEPIMIDSQLVSGQRRKRLYWTNIPNVEQPKDKGIKFQDILDSGYVHTNKSYCLSANYTGAYPADLFKSVRSQVFEVATVGEGFCVENEVVTINGYKRSTKNTVRVPGIRDGWYNIRAMTVAECCRLQTVPIEYMEGTKKTAAIKALGNGWTVDVIAHILSYI